VVLGVEVVRCLVSGVACIGIVLVPLQGREALLVRLTYDVALALEAIALCGGQYYIVV
jgi:hypothetical protein